MKRDIRKEQVSLLKFERLLKRQAKRIAEGRNADRAAIAAGLTGLFAVSASASVKAGEAMPAELVSQASDLVATSETVTGDVLVKVAEFIGSAHAIAEALALNAGLVLLQADGSPKEPPALAVKAILGL